MEKKVFMLGIAIVFSFIFNAQAQRGTYDHQAYHNQDSKQHYSKRHNHDTRQRKVKRYRKGYAHYNNNPYAYARSVYRPNCSPSQKWINGYYSYHPHFGYTWNNGFYAPVQNGRVWIPSQFVKRTHKPGFRKIPGHYRYI